MTGTFAAGLFAICVLIITIGVLWFHIVRPILEDFGVIRDEVAVNNYQEHIGGSPRVMSLGIEQTVQTDQANRQTNEVSDADRWLEQVGIDRTRTMLIRLLVYKGWGVGEIRNAIKGDSTAIGLEVEAARRDLGMAPSEGYRTPVAGRSTDAKFQEVI